MAFSMELLAVEEDIMVVVLQLVDMAVVEVVLLLFQDIQAVMP